MSVAKNHFVITLNSAKCNRCSQSIKISAGSTKGIWYHLESKHLKIYEKIKDAKKTIAKSPKPTKNPVVSSFIKPPKSVVQQLKESASESKDEAQDRLAPCRQEFSDEILPKKAASCKEKIAKTIGTKYYSLTAV